MKLKVGDFVRVKKETHNYNPLIIQGQIGRIIDCDYYNINRVYGIEFDFIDIKHLHNCRGKGKENQCDYVFEQDLELMSKEEYIEALERQLGENKQKDIEIRILKSFIILFHPEIAQVHGKNELNEDVFITLDEYYTIAEQEIRCQVCEEIREWCKKNFLSIITNKVGNWIELNERDFYKFLDQIEKGE